MGVSKTGGITVNQFSNKYGIRYQFVYQATVGLESRGGGWCGRGYKYDEEELRRAVYAQAEERAARMERKAEELREIMEAVKE